jgi:hypothetical protein
LLDAGFAVDVKPKLGEAVACRPVSHPWHFRLRYIAAVLTRANTSSAQMSWLVGLQQINPWGIDISRNAAIGFRPGKLFRSEGCGDEAPRTMRLSL